MSYRDEVILWDGPYGVAVTSVAPTERTMIDVGKSDIPKGNNFWVVKIEDLPADADQPTWSIEKIVGIREPDGVGGLE